MLAKLTKTEEEVMQLLWEAGRATVSELLAKIDEADRPPHSTLSSVVRILEKKGFVGFKAYGKTHEYFPVVTKDEYAHQSLGDVIQQYFDGSAASLLSHLVEKEQLSEADIAALLKKLS